MSYSRRTHHARSEPSSGTLHHERRDDSAALPNWSMLLTEAITRPGLIMRAYSAFHHYSLGNQMLALVQCERRNLQPGPINTFQGWQAKGRHVRKGERALLLCMPITCCKRGRETAAAEAGGAATFTAFVIKPRWFVLAQTEGEEMQAPELPQFDAMRALAALSIERVAFEVTDGNIQGYAKNRQIAINPVAQAPHKTFFHEAAHLCCLRSYVVLCGKALWNKAPSACGLNISFATKH